MRRLLLVAAVAALATPVAHRAGEPGWHPPPQPAVAAAGSVELAALTALVERTPEDGVPELVRSEPRFHQLDAAAKATLLESMRPSGGRVAAGVVLNAYPGLGVGSFVEGDWRGGAALLGCELAFWTVALVGVAQSPLLSSRTSGTGTAFLLVGAAGLVTTRVVGIVRAATYRGARHDVLKEALDATAPGASPKLTIAPVAGGAVALAGIEF
jgi:hypothetical protein